MYRIYCYDNKQDLPYRHLYMARKPNAYVDRADPKVCEKRMMESLYRTRRIIKDTLLCNRFSLFCTFTFSDEKVSDRFDYKLLSKQLRTFFNNYKKRECPDFKYLVIPEHHKNGAIHFHGVITCPYGLCTPLYIYKRICDGFLQRFPNKNHYCDFPAFSQRFGYFSCSEIRDSDRCATYVSKYITKELADWGKDVQLVLKSKGLKKPDLVYESDTDILQIPPNDCDNEYCQAAWADDDYTARFYKPWYFAYPQEIVSPENAWKSRPWYSYYDATGCVPMDCEQLTFSKDNSRNWYKNDGDK